MFNTEFDFCPPFRPGRSILSISPRWLSSPTPSSLRQRSREIVSSDPNALNFRIQLEFLIDGMDIDEEWCDNYLDGPAQEYLKSKSTQSVKKLRMGSHPKYDGNLNTYIHNETERNEALAVVGHVMEN